MTAESLPQIGIVTDEAVPDLTADGQALQSSLRERGIAATPVVWTDLSIQWDSFDVLLLRSCWEYYRTPAAFRDWLAARAQEDVIVWNPPSLVRWNMHKSYLRDLQVAGVDVLPTEWLRCGADADLAAICERRNWTEVVVKPAIGTGSHDVWRINAENGAQHQPEFERRLATEDLLVQEFAPEISEGELSLIFFDGRYSHANRSVPAAEEFRSQPDFGGEVLPASPSSAVCQQAKSVLEIAATLNDLALEDIRYARVDGIVRDDRLLLMELELIEPYLDLQQDEQILDRFASAIEATMPETLTSPEQHA